LKGTLYIGYPILASADESIIIEALMITEEHGIVVFNFDEKMADEKVLDFRARISDCQDKLYYSLKTNLGRHQTLRKGRELGVEPYMITFVPSLDALPEWEDVVVKDQDNVVEAIQACDPIESQYYTALNAAVQRVTTIKPAKRREEVQNQESKGGMLKKIEKEIANLDQWQRKCAIEQVEGIQRIRGLAGSGKTIALALKAAYLHSQYPNWQIAVVFQSRSLYQQFTDLIRRFTYEHMNDEPDFDRLRILHAWGSSNKMGAYAEMAAACDATPRDFNYARGTYGMQRAFHGICQELHNQIKNVDVKPLYDAVLIDEAQDLPMSFLRLIYKFTCEPKRIVFAYDELQSLGEEKTLPVAEFLSQILPSEEAAGEPKRDVVLPVCYRNTPWALSLAHALGLGIYREEGLVQFFDNPSVILDVGYEIVSGALDYGEKVRIRRSNRSYPAYFENYIDKIDSIKVECHDDEFQQAEYVAKSILKNVGSDELDLDDILIILPDTMRAKKQAKVVMDALAKNKIPSHMAGVTASQDMIFNKDSVAISNIYRAKGNEAPMVYVLNCNYCFGGRELIKKRNTLFTAITRSKAWVRLYGYGESMEGLREEIKQIVDNEYELEFSIPTPDQLQNMMRIHRELTPSEKKRIKTAEGGLQSFLEALESGLVDFEMLSPKQKKDLRELLNRSDE